MSVVLCGTGGAHTGATQKKKEKRSKEEVPGHTSKPRLNKHDSETITSLATDHATCDTCRLPAQLCAAGANAPCDEAFWTRQLASVFNCHELPYRNLNARLTYKFFCTSSAVEFAFFHAKQWGWVVGDIPANVAYEDATDIQWDGTPERKLNCGKFPDEYRQRMYAFIALVDGMDHFFYEEYNNHAPDGFLGEWRMPNEWLEDDEYDYGALPSWTLDDAPSDFTRLELAPGGEIACGCELDSDDDDDDDDDAHYEGDAEVYLSAVLPPRDSERGENRPIRFHLLSITDFKVDFTEDERDRFYNNFLRQSKLLFEMPEVLQMLRNTQRVLWTPQVEE